MYTTTSGVETTTGALAVYDVSLDPKKVFGVVAMGIFVAATLKNGRWRR